MSTIIPTSSYEDLQRIAEENELLAKSHLLNGRDLTKDTSVNTNKVTAINDLERFPSDKNETEDSFDARSMNDSHTTSSHQQIEISHDVISTLKSMMDEEIYESGVGAPSEKYFEAEYEKDHLAALNSLLCLFMNNYSILRGNEHYLVGCLHIISHMSYQDVYPFGQSMAMNAIIFKGSTEVQEYGIKCFEDWESMDGVDKLTAIQFPTKWLQDYANEVISEIKKANKWGITSEKSPVQSGRIAHAI